jgi:hypothetical protein
MTDQPRVDLAELAELADNALAGPWDASEPYEAADSSWVEIHGAGGFVPAMVSNAADAAVIVAAVNALPHLTDALNRVLELADALTTRYPEAGPHTRRLLAAIATDIRSAITGALKGDR